MDCSRKCFIFYSDLKRKKTDIMYIILLKEFKSIKTWQRMKNAVFMSHGPKDESSGMGFDIPCAGLNYHDYSSMCVWGGRRGVSWMG